MRRPGRVLRGTTASVWAGAPYNADRVSAQTVSLDSACYADCDQSGDLDFQNQFAAGDPEADCDGSSGLDFFDFPCFQNAFALGCP